MRKKKKKRKKIFLKTTIMLYIKRYSIQINIPIQSQKTLICYNDLDFIGYS